MGSSRGATVYAGQRRSACPRSLGRDRESRHSEIDQVSFGDLFVADLARIWLRSGDSELRTARFNAEGSEETEGAVKGRRADWRM
jgi:hypothetical protein